MNIFRTRFKRDIVAEFLPPRKPSRDVVIACPGMPGAPGKRELLELFSKKGFWIFLLRYRGTWESSGTFLEKEPTRDALDVLSELPRGFTDLWSGRQYKIKPRRVFVYGSSFGGPAALLASLDRRVNKVVAVSPVVDWTARSKDEPLDRLEGYVRSGYGPAYRFSSKNWKKLMAGKFYSPVYHVGEFDPEKILVIHAKDDVTVHFKEVKLFIDQIGCRLIILPRGGHSPFALFSKPHIQRAVWRFLRHESYPQAGA